MSEITGKVAGQRSIYRYTVPVDDQWHWIELAGPVVHVASRNPMEVVEFWVLHGEAPVRVRGFRVFGTGHPLPDGPLVHHGTVFAAGGRLVWHLVEHDNTVGER